MNERAKKHGTVIFALDEIQDLRKTKKFNITNILFHIYEHCKNIILVRSQRIIHMDDPIKYFLFNIYPVSKISYNMIQPYSVSIATYGIITSLVHFKY